MKIDFVFKDDQVTVNLYRKYVNIDSRNYLPSGVKDFLLKKYGIQLGTCLKPDSVVGEKSCASLEYATTPLTEQQVKQSGLDFVVEKPAPPIVPVPEEKNLVETDELGDTTLVNLKLAELRKLAEEAQMPNYSKAKKRDIIEFLQNQ